MREGGGDHIAVKVTTRAGQSHGLMMALWKEALSGKGPF